MHEFNFDQRYLKKNKEALFRKSHVFVEVFLIRFLLHHFTDFGSRVHPTCTLHIITHWCHFLYPFSVYFNTSLLMTQNNKWYEHKAQINPYWIYEFWMQIECLSFKSNGIISAIHTQRYKMIGIHAVTEAMFWPWLLMNWQ